MSDDLDATQLSINLPFDDLRARLRVRFQSQVVELDFTNPLVDLGRGVKNQIIVPKQEISASRMHAAVQFRDGLFYLIDRSSNGTYIRTHSGESMHIHHSEFPLSREGVIGLGREITLDDPLAIHFARFISPEEAVSMSQKHIEAFLDPEASLRKKANHEKTTLEMVLQSPLAMDMNLDECRKLANISEIRRLESNDILTREHERGNHLFCIINGNLSAEVESNKEGKKSTFTLHTMDPGDLAGEFGLIDDSQRTATLRAVGKTDVLALPRDSFQNFVQQNPLIGYKVLRAIIRSLRLTLVRMNMQNMDFDKYIRTQLHHSG